MNLNTRLNNGFTLVEMIMVLVIAGLVAAIIVPKWSSVSEEKTLEIETKKMLAHVKKMQQKARATQVAHGVRMNTATECYETGSYEPSIPQFYTEDTFCMSNNVDLRQHSFSSSNDVLYFNFLGVSTIVGYIQLQYKGASYLINVEPEGKLWLQAI